MDCQIEFAALPDLSPGCFGRECQTDDITRSAFSVVADSSRGCQLVFYVDTQLGFQGHWVNAFDANTA